MAVLAAPLVIPFAEALGLSVAILGMDKASDKVNQFIKDNPEESMKIFQMIMPAQGIANALKNKSSEEVEEKISLEDLEGMSDEEAQDLSKEDKAELMKQAGKSGGKNKRQTMIDISEKLGLSGEGKDKQDIEYEIDERYDEGGVEEVSKPKFDYKKFFKKRYADGGSIGIEVLFEEKKPRKDFSIGGQARPTDRVYDPRANVEDFTKALKSVSAGTTYQQQRQAQDYARQDASRRLSEAMRSGNQSGIQSILQGIGGSTSMGGMQFNRSGNRVTSVPATGPGRDKIINAMAQQMLNYTPSYQSLKPQPRDNLGLLMQDTIITDQMKSPAEMDAIRDRVLAAQKAQEQSYFMTDPVTGKKYSTEAEAIDDLGLVTYNQRFADGGRVGLFMGGDPLTGQALAIYNSMNSYGFSDQEIANALAAQGLYTPGSTPVVEEPVTNTAPNIINQDRGGDGPPNDPPKDPYGGLGYSSANFGLGKGINKDAVMDYEADAYEQGRTLTGQLNKIGLGIFSALKNIPTPFNLVRMGIQKAKDIARQKEIEKEMQQAAIARDIARSNKAAGTGGYQAGYDSGFMEGPPGAGYGMGAADKGGSDTMGSSKDGGLMGYGGKSGTPKGLATMFKKKR